MWLFRPIVPPPLEPGSSPAPRTTLLHALIPYFLTLPFYSLAQVQRIQNITNEINALDAQHTPSGTTNPPLFSFSAHHIFLNAPWIAFEPQAFLEPLVLRFRHARLPNMRNFPIALSKSRGHSYPCRACFPQRGLLLDSMALQPGSYYIHQLIRKYNYKHIPFIAPIHLMIYRTKLKFRLQTTNYRFQVCFQSFWGT